MLNVMKCGFALSPAIWFYYIWFGHPRDCDLKSPILHLLIIIEE